LSEPKSSVASTEKSLSRKEFASGLAVGNVHGNTDGEEMMTTDHGRRIYKLVDDELKKNAMGEPYGLVVEFCFAPQRNQEGVIVDMFPAWFVTVTTRATGIGEPDIGNGVPVPGIMPNDDLFRQAARWLLEKNRTDRDGAVQVAMSEEALRNRLSASGLELGRK
jgi:hypothetical protein